VVTSVAALSVANCGRRHEFI